MTHLGMIKELGINFSPLNDGDLRDRRWGGMESGEWRRVDMNDTSHPSEIGMSCNSLKCEMNGSYCSGQKYDSSLWRDKVTVFEKGKQKHKDTSAIAGYFTLQVLSMEPVTMREQSQLNWTLLISPVWPVRVWTRLRKTENVAVSALLYAESMAAMHILYSIPHDAHVQIDAITMTIVWPSWRNIPYSNCVVKGASDKLISQCVKAQGEDLCSVTLGEIKQRAWSLTFSFL